MPPPPPARNRFAPGNLVVSKTDPTDRRRILRVVNDSTMYETSSGAMSVAKLDANYENVNVSGGKHKSRRSRKRNKSKKNRSRKNRRKTSRRK